MDDESQKVINEELELSIKHAAELEREHLDEMYRARRRRMISAIAALFGGSTALVFFLFAYLSLTDKPYLETNIFGNRSLLISVFGLLVSSALLLSLSILSGKRQAAFDLYDVDRYANEQKREIESQFLSEKGAIRYIKTSLGDVSVHATDAERDVKSEISPEVKPEAYIKDLYFMSDFGRYLSGLIRYLNAQIEQSDTKASVLLVTGKMYVRRGIYFFVLSIIFWQIYGYVVKEISNVMIVGMVSCSLTFLVVEFLAAWFLKQYKEYVDAAIVYAKIKTQFDSIMLAYLSLKEFEEGGKEYLRDEMLKVLREPIAWPSNVGGKDIDHMRQMFDSLSTMLEKAKPLFKKDTPQQ
ncbi:hypothetical protein [uncultured Pseudomonas sp.]|uniref:hypothetical protein n=1 Tax=uncultured Pseudomonas sp. TaxID=114707 RepID=UPI00258D7973|nr:hypothetical protein [uncultured Pseudomonas sp.]